MRRLNVALITFVLLLSTFNIVIIEAKNNNIDSKKEENISNIKDEDTEYWALIVGVGEYAEHWDIPYMCHVAEELKKSLLKSDSWDESHIKLITGKNATVRNIIKGLKWLDRMEDKNDISFVYIDTHGGSISKDYFPKDEEDGKDEVLASYWGLALPYAVILDDTLNRHLSKLESKGTAVIISSCHAGGFNDKPRNKKFQLFPLENIKQKFSLNPKKWMEDFGREIRKKGRVVIMSCEENEVSMLGCFCPYLMDAFNGFGDINNDKIITVEEIYEYAFKRTKKWVQNPTIYDDYEGELPLIDISYKEIENNEKNDISLVSYNNQTSTICGIVRDNVTNCPIENVNITLHWRNNQGSSYTNYTTSNLSGFYRFRVEPGIVNLAFFSPGYYNKGLSSIDIEEKTTIWKNVSLKIVNETSLICGYIKDNLTNFTLENANISIIWSDNQTNYYINNTFSNSTGFYKINVSAGLVRIFVSKEGYYSSYWPESFVYNISNNEKKWANISIDPTPPKNSFIKGYVKDYLTGDPINNVKINIYWKDNQGHQDFNSTRTDINGFYNFNICKGYVRLYYQKEGYFSEVISWIYLEENESMWLNTSLNYSSWNYSICGYVNNTENNLPIENAIIEIRWEDLQGNNHLGIANSNETGFYKIILKEGIIKYLSIEAKGFFYYQQDLDYKTCENKTIWFNFSLVPRPQETAKIKGYIKDSEIQLPIENATVFLNWYDYENLDLYYRNTTKSDSSGFYCFNVAPGDVIIDVKAEGYFYGNYHINHEFEEGEILWANLSLDKTLSENAKICGFINNFETNEPMAEVEIRLIWTDLKYKHDNSNYTSSNSSGFYSFNVAEGKIYLEANSDGYLNEYSKLIDINEDDKLWINLSMYEKPSLNSTICGYVKDSLTNEPIERAYVDIEWIGSYWHHQDFFNFITDKDGHYQINIPAGELYLRAGKSEYSYKDSNRIDIKEKQKIWYNITLDHKKIDIEFNKPLPALYLKNKLKSPLTRSIIIGDIDIEILVWNMEFEKLELYIDNELKLQIKNESHNKVFYSYSWTKNKLKLFGHKHTIKAVVYDKEGNIDSEEIKVWKFF